MASFPRRRESSVARRKNLDPGPRATRSPGMTHPFPIAARPAAGRSWTGGSLLRIHRSQDVLLHLAHRVARKGGDHVYALGNLEAREVGFPHREQLPLLQRVSAAD